MSGGLTDSERISHLEAIADQHTEKLDEIGKDVKSLLESRSFTRGAISAASALAAGISVLISLLIAWLRQ